MFYKPTLSYRHFEASNAKAQERRMFWKRLQLSFWKKIRRAPPASLDANRHFSLGKFHEKLFRQILSLHTNLSACKPLYAHEQKVVIWAKTSTKNLNARKSKADGTVAVRWKQFCFMRHVAKAVLIKRGVFSLFVIQIANAHHSFFRYNHERAV